MCDYIIKLRQYHTIPYLCADDHGGYVGELHADSVEDLEPEIHSLAIVVLDCCCELVSVVM